MPNIVVIGGGIVGASTAYHLVKQGANVTLVDRNDRGQATDAGAGIICPWLTNRKNKSWYRLVENGAHYYPKLTQSLQADGEAETGYAQVGAINIYDTEQKLDNKLEVAQNRKTYTPDMGEVTKLSAEETRQIFPPLSDRFGAVHISGGARVNGSAVRDALIRAAKKVGMKFVHGSASLIYQGSTVNGVLVNGSTIPADRVISTGGAWDNELLKPLGLNYQVAPQKAQIVHLQMPNTDTSNWPVVMAPYNQYMLTFKNGRVVIGTTHEDQAGFNHDVTVSGMHGIIDKALQVAPGLTESTYLETKVGFRPFTPGSLPIIGRVPQVDGLYVANGLGASGLTSGPYVGDQLAKLVLGQATELDFKDYDVASAIVEK
ncbi:NAD(P)/FAD-dependent oxidoreductase [Aquibacillus sediminis]|uniref:NAD(P)/FAD-dependent oxidoreductase n=1 Tax=Aquibacillus sediminis TaxID=2574734 RepID=UPI001109D502|nr:FAD-binding oxidoreductase [Aquibacillus sediminis]